VVFVPESDFSSNGSVIHQAGQLSNKVEAEEDGILVGKNTGQSTMTFLECQRMVG